MALQRLATFRTNLTRMQERITGYELPERFRGTIVEKWAKYWRQLVSDYKDMVIDTGRDMRNKPFKTSVYLGLLTGSYLCCKNNPDEQSFFEEIRKYNNEMMLLAEPCQNPVSVDHLVFVERCKNAGLLRRLTLGVVSFIWVDNYDKDLALYKSTCSYLKPEYLKFHERVIDVGFWNKWWTLSEKMVDYDINEDNV
jgi:Translocase of the Inner Mitochondrial membrane 29